MDDIMRRLIAAIDKVTGTPSGQTEVLGIQVHADDLAEAERLAEADPDSIFGLARRAGVRVLEGPLGTPGSAMAIYPKDDENDEANIDG